MNEITGLIKDLFNKHENLKFAGIGIAISSTFWYLDIFIFKRELILLYPFYVPLVICFCLSYCWYSVSHLFLSLVRTMIKTTDEGIIIPYLLLRINNTFSPYSLVIFTVIGYIQKWSFVHLIFQSFKIAGIIFLSLFLIFVFSSIRKNNRVKNTLK